jgi:hypothetical protein
LRFFSSTDPYERAKIILPVVFIVFVLVVGGFIADSVSEDRAREQLLGALDRASAVRFNGQVLDHSDVILRVLKSLHHVPAHHSGPDDPLRLELVSGNATTAITIARDSRTPGEYWIYRPGSNWHGNPLGEEAGRVANGALDTLLPWPRR